MCFLISWGKVAFSICVDEPELKLIFYLFSQRMETLFYAEISQGFSHNFNSSITLFWKSVIRFLNCNKVFFPIFLWCKEACDVRRLRGLVLWVCISDFHKVLIWESSLCHVSENLMSPIQNVYNILRKWY